MVIGGDARQYRLLLVAHDAEDGAVGFFHSLGTHASDVADGALDVLLDDTVVVGLDAAGGEQGGLYGCRYAGVHFQGAALLGSVAHHAGEPGAHGLDGIDHLVVVPAHEVGDGGGGAGAGDHDSAKSGKVTKVVVYVGGDEVTEGEGADELLAGGTEFLGGHDDGHVNGDSLVTAAGVGHNGLGASVHAGVGGGCGADEGIVEQVVLE